MKIQSTRRLFLQGTAAAGVATTLVACGQQSPSEQGQNGGTGEVDLQLPSTAWERAEYDGVEDGGTITLSIGQIPANFNQNHADGNELSTSTIRNPCGLENVVPIDENGQISYNPDYITSVELTSEEPQVVNVKFNEKAVWEDGTPITVDDFISQWKAQNGSNEEYNVVSTQGWDRISEIRKVSDFEAEVQYDSPFADWKYYVYPDLPAKVTATPEAFNNDHQSTPLPSSGPFRIDSVDATGGVVTLVRNEKWWGRPAKLERIIFKVTTQQNAPSAFANSELDALDIGDGDTYGQAKNRADANIQKSNGLTWTHLTLNTQGTPGVLDNVEVRKAIFYAVDRAAVGRAVVEPLESPVVLKNNYIYMPGQEGYQDSFDGNLEFNAETAKEILEADGWAMNASNVYEKDGTELAFTIIIPAEAKSNEDRATQVLTNLNAIGFNVNMETVPSDKYFTEYVQPGSFGAVTFSWVGTAAAELSAPNIYLPGTTQNFTGYKDTELNTINDRIQSELDPEKRREIANEYSKRVAESYTILPFYATPIITGVTNGLVNYGAKQFESVDWTAVGFKA